MPKGAGRMQISIGNAPCSWGVEFADDPRNPHWAKVLNEAKEAGYVGIELGPVGFMPEDPGILGPALKARCLTLIGGVVFRPFHDPAKWDELQDYALRTCVNLPEKGPGRWRQALTPAVMKRCHWVEPVLVAQIKFTEWINRQKKWFAN